MCLDVAYKTGLQALIQTSIYASILKIIASNFQKMLLSGSTLQTHYKFDFDLYSYRVPFVISWPIYLYSRDLKAMDGSHFKLCDVTQP